MDCGEDVRLDISFSWEGDISGCAQWHTKLENLDTYGLLYM